MMLPKSVNVIGVSFLNTALAVSLVLICWHTDPAQRKTIGHKPAAQKQSSRTRPSSPAKKRPGVEPSAQLGPLPPDPAVENADISITAHVRAKSLKFETVGNPKVEFFGAPARDTVWEAQRENLPTPVQPGVTYRNIGIRLKITSVFRDIDRIVAEALGEVPVSDGKPTTEQAANPSASSKTPSSGSQRTAQQPPSREHP